MAKQAKNPRVARLPSGKYSWRGRAISFSKLPKATKHKLRVKWAKKGATVSKILKKTNIPDATSPRVKIRRAELKDAWVYDISVNKNDGESNRAALELLWTAQRNDRPFLTFCILSAMVKWPDDERSEKRKPYRTGVGTPPKRIGREVFKNFWEALDEVEAAGSAYLKRFKKDGTPGSGARGKAVVTMVSMLAWKGSKKTPRGKNNGKRAR